MGSKSHFYTHPSPQGYIYTAQQPVTRSHTHTCTFYPSTPHRSLLVMGIYWTVWALPNHTNTSKWQINGKLKDRHVMGADYGSYLLILLIRLVGEAMPLAKPQIPEKVMAGKIAHVTQSKLDESAVHCHSLWWWLPKKVLWVDCAENLQCVRKIHLQQSKQIRSHTLHTRRQKEIAWSVSSHESFTAHI